MEFWSKLYVKKWPERKVEYLGSVQRIMYAMVYELPERNIH